MQKSNPVLSLFVAASLIAATNSASASIATETLDFVRSRVAIFASGTDNAVVAPASVSELTTSVREGVTSGLDDSFDVLKVGGVIDLAQTHSPTLLLRKGLFTEVGESHDQLWIGLMFKRSAFEAAEIPGTTLTRFDAVTEQFSRVYDELINENPTFNLGFVSQADTTGQGMRHQPIRPIGRSDTEVGMGEMNVDLATINSEEMWIVNIAISADDNVEDVLGFIQAMSTRMTLPTNIGG